MGISAVVAGASWLADERLAGRAPEADRLAFLNIGVSSTTAIPADLRKRLRAAGLENVAHLEDINLVDDLDERRLAAVAERCDILDARWLQEDLGVWVWDDTPLVGEMTPPIFDRASLEQAARNVLRIMEVTKRPFLAENPPLHFALGDIDLLSFMSGVSERSGCGLVLDVGHLVSYCIVTGRNPARYLAEWRGLDRIVEIHVAGFETMATNRGVLWWDMHDVALDARSLDVLDVAVQHAPNVRAITVEVEEASWETLWSNFEKVEQRVEPLAAE
jgi:uncharacterized protein (UPF0276 family)